MATKHKAMAYAETGLRNIATRQAQAVETFLDTLASAGGLTKDEAVKVYLVYKKAKVLMLDSVNGTMRVKHGGLLDRDVIRRALEK